MDSILPDGELLFEARRLQEMMRYEFWVSASTTVGEGRGSVKLTQAPLSKGRYMIPGMAKLPRVLHSWTPDK